MKRLLLLLDNIINKPFGKSDILKLIDNAFSYLTDPTFSS